MHTLKPLARIYLRLRGRTIFLRSFILLPIILLYTPSHNPPHLSCVFKKQGGINLPPCNFAPKPNALAYPAFSPVAVYCLGFVYFVRSSAAGSYSHNY